jgi:hypothetical protein
MDVVHAGASTFPFRERLRTASGARRVPLLGRVESQAPGRSRSGAAGRRESFWRIDRHPPRQQGRRTGRREGATPALSAGSRAPRSQSRLRSRRVRVPTPPGITTAVRRVGQPRKDAPPPGRLLPRPAALPRGSAAPWVGRSEGTRCHSMPPNGPAPARGTGGAPAMGLGFGWILEWHTTSPWEPVGKRRMAPWRPLAAEPWSCHPRPGPPVQPGEWRTFDFR